MKALAPFKTTALDHKKCPPVVVRDQASLFKALMREATETVPCQWIVIVGKIDLCANQDADTNLPVEHVMRESSTKWYVQAKGNKVSFTGSSAYHIISLQCRVRTDMACAD